DLLNQRLHISVILIRRGFDDALDRTLVPLQLVRKLKRGHFAALILRSIQLLLKRIPQAADRVCNTSGYSCDPCVEREVSQVRFRCVRIGQSQLLVEYFTHFTPQGLCVRRSGGNWSDEARRLHAVVHVLNNRRNSGLIVIAPFELAVHCSLSIVDADDNVSLERCVRSNHHANVARHLDQKDPRLVYFWWSGTRCDEST